jgi:hypothetical protein
VKKALLLALLASIGCKQTNERPCTFTLSGAASGSGSCTAWNAIYGEGASLAVGDYGWSHLQIEPNGGAWSLSADLWFEQDPTISLTNPTVDRSGTSVTLTGATSHAWDGGAYTIDVTNSTLKMTEGTSGYEHVHYDVEGTAVIGLSGGVTLTVSF